MDLLLNTFTKALGWSMLHSLWQGAAIYTIVCFLYLFFPNLNASTKYRFAYGSQVLIFALFCSTLVYYMNISSLVMQVDANNYLAFTTILNQYPEKFNSIEQVFPWFTALYVIGLLIQLIFFSNSYNRLSYLRRQGISDAPIAWSKSLNRIKSEIKIARKIRLHLSDKIFSPLTIGHLKPLILFPIALVNQMDLNQVEAILLHELAHIKRNDYLFNLIGVLIETILFFNPFIWLLSKHVKTEREHACDDVVVEKMVSPISYAQALVALETLDHKINTPFAMHATGKKQHLLHRIKRITQMEKNYINVKQHLFAIGISSLAFATIAWIAPEQNKIEKETISSSELLFDTIEKHTALTESFVNEKIQEEALICLHDTSKGKSSGLKQPITIISDSLTLEILHNSPEWKEKFAKIEAKSKEIEAHYNSPEWKEKIAKIEANGKRIEEHYNSPEWKEKIAKIEANGKRIEVYYNSPEWKEKIAKIEANGKRIEAYYNSPEWKEKIADIEANVKTSGTFLNSEEGKTMLNDIISQTTGLVNDILNSTTLSNGLEQAKRNATEQK